MSELRDKVEKILLSRYEEKGFLSEDEIIDICIDHDVDLVEIDAICDRLLSKKIIMRDESSTVDDDDEDGSIVDRSHLDYEALFYLVESKYPNCKTLISEIRNIMPPQTREWQTLIREAQNGNNFARDRIVQMYLRTVLKHAYDFSETYYCDFEDAFQNAVVGLITAINKFDVTSPDTFVSYYPLWVRQAMQRSCEVRGTICRYPAHYKDKVFRFISTISSFIEDDNLEGAINLLDDDVFCELLEEEPTLMTHVFPYIEVPEDIMNDSDLDADIMRNEVRTVLGKAMETLSRRAPKVLEMRYGWYDDYERTLEEVGNVFEVTRERIRQIESKALKTLKGNKKVRQFKDYL